VPWWVLRRRRRRRLLEAADALMDDIVGRRPAQRQAVHGVSVRRMPARVVVYLGGGAVPAFVPPFVRGFPVVVAYRDEYA
jgi:hypothetical protein